jgi:hypothetical protein
MTDHKKILSSKKSIHINIERETHADMRSILFKKDLTMQDFFSSCASSLASEETYFMDFLDAIRRSKENKELKKISSDEIDRIYDLLESESPV